MLELDPSVGKTSTCDGQTLVEIKEKEGLDLIQIIIRTEVDRPKISII